MSRCLVVGWLALGLSTFSPTAGALGPQGTGALGAFEPAADTVVTLPADGVLQYTRFVVPQGVTVTFAPAAGNPPVTILVQGDAEVHGTLRLDGDVSGGAAAGIVALGGPGGPGGSTGGSGLVVGGLPGHGPSGAHGTGECQAGGGGSPRSGGVDGGRCGCGGTGGLAVGGRFPLHGGSGGGGSTAHGGGGGGGSLTLAAPTLQVEGLISATGGSATGRAGGGGGGVIRLVAGTITGQGLLLATGGVATEGCDAGGKGAPGLIRLEADEVDVSLFLASAPLAEEGAPKTTQPWGSVTPTLTIQQVAGATPGPTTDHVDLAPALSVESGALVTVTLTATGVAPGAKAQVAVARAGGERTVSTSTPFALQNGVLTATAEVRLPTGAGAGSLEAWIASYDGP